MLSKHFFLKITNIYLLSKDFKRKSNNPVITYAHFPTTIKMALTKNPSFLLVAKNYRPLETPNENNDCSRFLAQLKCRNL